MLWLLSADFNPFMPNGISHCCQLDQFISILRVLRGIFPFYSNFNRTFSKQTVETLIRPAFYAVWSGSALFVCVPQEGQ